MREANSDIRIISTLESILNISFFIYLFLLIFPHTTTPKEIAFWVTFLSWALLRLKKSGPFIPLNPVIISFSLFMILAFISSITGMEPVKENIGRFKGELLTPFILFLIALTEFNNIEKARQLLSALLIAFAINTILAIAESLNYGLSYFWDKTNREQFLWLTSYSQKGAVIFPLILGMFLFIEKKWLKYSLMVFAFAEFTILTAYRGLTVFLGVFSVLLLWAIFARPKKYRQWMITFISLFTIVFLLAAYINKENPVLSEYRLKLAKIVNIHGEFTSEGGFSNRMPAWQAAVDIIKDRPLLGYGWGMKKYTELVGQEKFLEKWKVEKPYVYEFYTVYKNVFFPPHNLFLEVALQGGLLGLGAFIIFLGAYLFYLIKSVVHNGTDTAYNFSIILIGGTLLSFMIMSLMSNELGNVSGKILFTVLGLGAARVKNT
jgi:O-antigen ligase